MQDELPEYIQKTVDRIRARRKGLNSTLEDLLEKWKKGDAAERERIEHLLLQLAKPNKSPLFFGLVFGTIACALGFHFFSELALEAKVNSGERAVARVDRLSEGFCFFGSKGNKCVELELHVTPRGRPGFRAVVTRSLSNTWLSRVQPGSYVTVALDAESPGTVYLNEKALEEAPPAPPQVD